jgi:MscS family membrane protein
MAAAAGMMRCWRAALIVWMLAVAGAAAQEGAAPAGGATRLEPLRTSSPRETLATFYRLASQMEHRLDRYAMSKTDFRARRVSAVVTDFIEIIDLSGAPVATRRDIAADTFARLMDIFGRIDPIDLDTVPGRDAYPDDSGAASWRIPGTPLRIVHMTEGDKEGEFLFGPRTPVLSERFLPRAQDLPLRQETDLPVRSWPLTFAQWTGPVIPAGTAQAMPAELRELVLDTPVWKIILTALIALGLAVGIGLAHWFLAGRGGRSVGAILRRAVTPVLIVLAAGWLGPFLQYQISPSGDFAALADSALVVAAYIAFLWMAWLAVGALFAVIMRVRNVPEEGFDADLWHLASTVVAVAVSVLILLEGASLLGLPLASILAGLGIGGLAVALAIRPTLENLIGGVILYIDQPVRVGDFCSFGDKSGTIEAIGVRSTKIRALDRTVITVPNAALADMQLTNYARCDRMLIQKTVGLRYETSADKARYVLVKIREMLHAHPKIDAETVRVRFADYGSSSLDIAIRVYALTNDWNEYFAVQEDILLRMKDLVEKAGSGFAFPSQTLYLARDGGLDEDAGSASEAEVDRWRRRSELAFPRLSRARLDALQGTLDYPPKGSVEAAGEETGWEDSAERLSAAPDDDEEDQTKGDRQEKV